MNKENRVCVTIQLTKDVQIELDKATNTLIFISEDLKKFSELENKLYQAGLSVKAYIRKAMDYADGK